MTWAEFLIIYLACGAPFGVYQATRGSTTVDGPNLLTVVFAVFVWPALAFGSVKKRLFPGEEQRITGLNRRIERVRGEIEEIAFPVADAPKRLEFRGVFYRYSGLAMAFLHETTASREVLEVSGHSNPGLGARCLARRDREKLVFHLTQARTKFVDLIAGVAINDRRVVDLAADLARELGDGDAVAELNAAARPAATAEVRPTRPASAAKVS